MEIQTVILVLTDLLICTSFIYGLFFFKRLSSELKSLFWFIVLSLCTQFPAQYLSFNNVSNLFLLHFYVPLSFVCLTFFYQRIFGEFINRRLLWWILVVFICLSILNSVFLQGFDVFNSFALSIESTLIIIYALSLYVLLLNPLVREEKRPVLSIWMWINSGLFIYHTSGLLLFYFGEVLTSFAPVKFRISWLFHSFIYLFQFICIIIGLWKHHKRLVS